MRKHKSKLYREHVPSNVPFPEIANGKPWRVMEAADGIPSLYAPRRVVEAPTGASTFDETMRKLVVAKAKWGHSNSHRRMAEKYGVPRAALSCAETLLTQQVLCKRKLAAPGDFEAEAELLGLKGFLESIATPIQGRPSADEEARASKHNARFAETAAAIAHTKAGMALINGMSSRLFKVTDKKGTESAHYLRAARVWNSAWNGAGKLLASLEKRRYGGATWSTILEKNPRRQGVTLDKGICAQMARILAPLFEPDPKAVPIIQYNDSGREARWGAMEMQEPRRQEFSGATRSARRFRSSDCGTSPARPHRLLTDGACFRSKRKVIGGSILLDCSGSMRLTTKDIRNVLVAAPFATVACYDGREYNKGGLRILAMKGRKVSDRDVRAPMQGGGNTVDYPALMWLTEQGAPRIWISDGQVVGVGVDPMSRAHVEDCADACTKGSIRRIGSVDVAIEFFKHLKRNPHKYVKEIRDAERQSKQYEANLEKMYGLKIERAEGSDKIVR